MKSTACYKLVWLANGAHSIRSLEHGETFHPVIGPAAEAEVLYVNQLKLRERAQSEFVVWDVGLGAAANAIAVVKSLEEILCKLRLVSFDQTLKPLKFALEHTGELSYLQSCEAIVNDLLENQRATFTRKQLNCEWELHLGDFPTLLKNLPRHGSTIARPHAILFDAYSPVKNPAMWTQELFTNLFRALDPHRPCSLATYSRSTMLRVSLLLAGFFVGAGHATGEKEETTIAANDLKLLEHPLDYRWLKRAKNSTSAEPLREAAYRQAPLSEDTWKLLQRHPQFQA